MQAPFPQSTPEKVSRQFYVKDDLSQTQTIILITCVCTIFLSYGDYLNFDFSPALSNLVCARLLFLLFSAIILHLLQQVNTPRHHDYLVFLWAAFFLLLILYVNVSRPVTNIRFSHLDPLIILSIYVFFPHNIYLQLALASLFTLGDLTVIWFFKDPGTLLSLKTIELAYLIANILGLFTAYRLRQFRQRQYTFFLQEQTMRKELEKVAFIDYLTGALNRRKFLQMSFLEFSKFKNTEIPFSIIMFDLDFFKNLNDQYGHAAGDTYLKAFSSILTTNKRNQDILGRLGGEEFALLLPGTQLNTALALAENLRQLCEHNQVSFENHLLQATVSIGVTSAWKKDRTLQDVLNRADITLYQAKGNGRNQIRFCLETEDAGL